MNCGSNHHSLFRAIAAGKLSLVLAAMLECLPLVRSQVLIQSAFPTVAWVFRWALGGVSTLGAFDAVSAASATISGLTLYQNNRPSGKALSQVVTRVGVPFNYRITVVNPGGNRETDYFQILPNPPPGLNLNTNVGGAGFITGIPSLAGVYPVVLVAGNTRYAIPETFNATIVVEPLLQAPIITSQPRSRTVIAGDTVEFSVAVDGVDPISFQWFLDETALTGATNAVLTLEAVQPSQQGSYWVAVSNPIDTVISAPATLTVQQRFSVAPRLTEWTVKDQQMTFRIIGPTAVPLVLWISSDFSAWTAIRTNQMADGVWQYSESRMENLRFYRVSIAP
jgi:hypothetical protein